MSTYRLPTDKHGNVYYGETTYNEACQTAQRLQDDCFDERITKQQMTAGWRQIEARLRNAGYVKLADKFHKDWLS